jgi:hypothetical protein
MVVAAKRWFAIYSSKRETRQKRFTAGRTQFAPHNIRAIALLSRFREK